MPRDLHYNFRKKAFVYYLEIEDDYLENHDGRFHFAAEFDCPVVCDVVLNKKQISIAGNTPHKKVTFDGFKEHSDSSHTKTLFLKSLQKIKQITNDFDQIKRAEEQNSNIYIKIFDCVYYRPYKLLRGGVCYPSAGDKRSFDGKAVGGGSTISKSSINDHNFEQLECTRNLKPVFVESSKMNSTIWRVVYCERGTQLIQVKIVFDIIKSNNQSSFTVV